MRRSAKVTASSLVAVAALMLGAVQASGVAPDGTGHVSASAPTLKISTARRGNGGNISGSGFTPDHQYIVRSDVFTLRGHRARKVTTGAAGTFFVRGFAHRTIPITTHHGVVVVRDAATHSLVARQQVDVAAPFLQHRGALMCPGVSDYFAAVWFPTGTYTLRTKAVVLHRYVIHEGKGRGEKVIPYRMRPNYSHPYFTVTIVPHKNPAAAIRQRVKVDQPFIAGVIHHGQARQFLTGFCFNASQRLRVTPSSAGVRGTVRAGTRGRVHVLVHPHALTRRRVITLHLTSEPSGRGTTYPLKVASTTLRTGQLFGSHLTKVQHLRELRSPKYDYRAATYHKGCRMGVSDVTITKDGHARLRSIWMVGKKPTKAGFGDCSAQIMPTGNLVLTSSTQGTVWQSHTAGTGSNNRLVLRESGRLQLITAKGRVVWHSPADTAGS